MSGERRLLQDIEDHGGLYKVKFAIVCATDYTFYGKGGGPRRRKFQRRVDNLKRLSTVQKYVNIFDILAG